MKKLIIPTIVSSVLMLGFPWFTVTFGGMSGMGIFFLLFYIVNPLFSAFCGIFAGINIRQLWSLPLIVSALFLAGAWIFFELGEPDFLLYAAGYLIIGFAAMLLSYAIKRSR